MLCLLWVCPNRPADGPRMAVEASRDSGGPFLRPGASEPSALPYGPAQPCLVAYAPRPRGAGRSVATARGFELHERAKRARKSEISDGEAGAVESIGALRRRSRSTLYLMRVIP